MKKDPPPNIQTDGRQLPLACVPMFAADTKPCRVVVTEYFMRVAAVATATAAPVAQFVRSGLLDVFLGVASQDGGAGECVDALIISPPKAQITEEASMCFSRDAYRDDAPKLIDFLKVHFAHYQTLTECYNQ